MGKLKNVGAVGVSREDNGVDNAECPCFTIVGGDTQHNHEAAVYAVLAELHGRTTDELVRYERRTSPSRSMTTRIFAMANGPDPIPTFVNGYITELMLEVMSDLTK